ncbi:LuxR family transcriptional regulator [Nocardia sp. BMG111209]|uniref:AAA family ATPase n=1 Tax=Nocardia sp. BMG111209 TaxID=1160137 RepID=UPI0003A7D182|nr:LuxR family transcriptional regulator [Nocardia sp. BMG111209]
MRTIEGICGRERERAAVDDTLAALREGRGSALLWWGDPGTGKTAMLRYAAESAPDCRILACSGVAAESPLTFAALHQLLWPVADRIADLPGPQAAALRVALGLGAGVAGEFHVATAVVTLLSRLAATAPVLLSIDDLQWLDEATARTLRFVLRRTTAVPIGLLAACDGDPAGTQWNSLPARWLGPLAEPDARALLRQRHGTLSAFRSGRVLAVSGGNPLALCELPVTAPEYEGTASRPAPVGSRVRQVFAQRLAALSGPLRTLLVVVAAEDLGDLAIVSRVATESGVGELIWSQAGAAGLVRIGDGRIVVGNPLLCALAYEVAAAEQRGWVHRALAEALVAAGEPDLALWHRAAATAGPDDELARALANSARRRAERSGRLTGAMVLRRAAEMCTDADRAGRWLAWAARAAWEAGDVESARALLDRAGGALPADRMAASTAGLAGLLEMATGSPARAGEMLARDAALVREPMAGDLRRVAERAEWAAGRSEPEPDIAPLLDRLDEVTAASPPGVAARLLPPAALVLAWGLAGRALGPYTEVAARLRDSGDIAGLAYLLPQLVAVQIATDQWAEAGVTLREATRLAEAGDWENTQAACHNLAAKLASFRGDSAAVEFHVEQALALARPRRMRVLIAGAYWHRGVHELSIGNPEAAYELLRTLSLPEHESAHPTIARLAAADIVESAWRSGNFEAATTHSELLRAWALRSRAPWAVASTYRVLALQSEGFVAERYFRRALEVRGMPRNTFHRARTGLLYGEWLRRARRRADAAEQLRLAYEGFQRIEAGLWMKRAARELELTDAPSGGRRGSDTLLTGQELRIAELAVAGLTNRAIAGELAISPRTVGHHLSQVFAKLGVRDRKSLMFVDLGSGLSTARSESTG